MQEASNLLNAMRRLIAVDEATYEQYGADAVSLMEAGLFTYAAAMFRAGDPHRRRAEALRVELVELQVRYGPIEGPPSAAE